MAYVAHQRADGQNYAPSSTGVVKKVCTPEDFPVAFAHIDHGHIYGMANGLQEAGAGLALVYDPDPARVDAFVKVYPQVRRAASLDEVLADPSIKMVATSAVNADRAPLGMRMMDAGKDFFCDKPLFTSQEQIDAARGACARTGRKYMGYFSERLHVECAVKAGELIREGAIGRVISVTGMGPHRLAEPTRPAWFFDPARYGGILCDIGCHQIEAFLYFTGAKSATVNSARIANFANKKHPEFQDYGDMTLTADNGAAGYFRLEWMTPPALEVWGDGRTFIIGTEGYIELRKYTDVAGTREPDSLFLVNGTRNERINCHGQVGFPFFGEMILDCLHRTENAMTQEHIFVTSELAVRAQSMAQVIE